MEQQPQPRQRWGDLPTSEWERLIALEEGGKFDLLDQEAKRLGMTTTALMRNIKATKASRDRYKEQLIIEAIPESPSPIRDEFDVVHTQDAIIISDIEVPDYSAFMLKAALATAMRFNIRKCIFAGDIIATDQDSLNRWLTTWRDEHGRSFEADIKELKRIIRAYAAWFTDGIWGVLGNHDMRLAIKTGGEVTLDMLIAGTGLQLGQYSYLYLFNPRTQEWTYVCHQFNYSKTSVKLAQDIWSVVTAPDGWDNTTGERIPGYNPDVHGWNKQKCHVVITHTHVAQAGSSPDDNWQCIGMGCMRDQRRTKYTQARATKFPRWSNAFVLMRNGYMTPYHRKFTDWRTLLGEDLYDMLMNKEVALEGVK